VAGKNKTKLNNDIELIKKVLLEQEDPAIAKRKLTKLLNLMNRVIPLDATAIKEESGIDWEHQKSKAVKCIREAATRLSDPSKVRESPVLAEHWDELSQEERGNLGYPVSLDLSNPEILGRCLEHGFVSYALDQIANTISKIPGDKFRQTQNYDLLDVDPSNIGIRGGNSKKPGRGRTKALLVKELAEIVPKSMENRYSMIARFARFRDSTVDRHYVRATLMRGRT